MQEIDPLVILAVLQELFGLWLWAGLIAALLVLVAFLAVVVRDRGLHTRRLRWSQAVGLLGGIAAVLAAQVLTDSSFADIGGPIDWVAIAAIFVAGALAGLVIVYAALGVARRLG